MTEETVFETMEQQLARQKNKFYVTDSALLDDLLSKLNRTQATVWANRTDKLAAAAKRRWQRGLLTDAEYDAEYLQIQIATALRFCQLLGIDFRQE